MALRWSANLILKLRQKPEIAAVVAISGLIVAAVSFGKDVLDLADKAQVQLGLKPDSLQIANEDAKGKFSRELTRSAWRRMFWMRRYGLAVEDGLPTQDRKDTWESYLKVLDEWNADLMVNIMLINKYYGLEKRRFFEQKIQPQFGELHSCINRLHYKEIYEKKNSSTCKFSGQNSEEEIQNAVEFRKRLDSLNIDLYCFVSGLDAKGRFCGHHNQ
ncbi:hypothetical protein [Azospirillum tabaci]|uniref:hypothetical protein n=1 Tax=Azospirillum tabaci TaxID=2752310 RepID=UPI001661616C|nr:hypothetical protein [Azospirillum tabaci]